MSQKMVLAIGGVVVLVAVVAWYFFYAGVPGTTLSGASPRMVEDSGSAASTQGISAQGTTNADLEADLQAFDGQLQGASADASSAQSFNDTPVEQTE